MKKTVDIAKFVHSVIVKISYDNISLSHAPQMSFP